VKAVDLFAGWGGFTLGARDAGVDVVWAANHWELAVRTHSLNHPETTHVCQDLRQADWTALPDFDVMLASPACFAPHTAVTTTRGVIPIADVVVGDLALTHRGRWRRVTAVMSRRADTVVLAGVETTADHRFWTCSEPVSGTPASPQWCPTARVAGRYLATPAVIDDDTGTTESAVPAAVRDCPTEVWAQLGYWLAGAGERPPALCSVLDDAPVMPGWALALDQPSRQAIWDAWRGANTGCRQGAAVVSPDRTLAVAARLLATSLGWSVGPVHRETGTSPRRGSWAVLVTADPPSANPPSANPPSANPPFAKPPSAKPPSANPPLAPAGDRWAWRRQRSGLTPAGRDVEVFDLTVDEDHSFVADGFVVHNCQGHSTASQPRRRAYHDALRATALAVVDAADVCHPRAIVVENVLSFTSWRLYGWWREGLERLGYRLDSRVLTASHFGVPQRRRRLFIVATLDGVEVPELVTDPAEPAIGPVLEPASACTWRLVADASPGVRARVEHGRRRHGPRFVTQHTTGHAGVPLHEPLRTVTTAPAHWNVVDGERYRALTPRELARAMGFPDSFVWPDEVSMADATRGLGNAVCPPVASALVRAVSDALS
jgi:DNA (cytosine-5)-methyltransferase 1